MSLLIALGVGACAFFPPSAPNDLKLESLRVIDLKDAPEIVRRDIERFNNHPRKVLQISFSSSQDLIAFARNNDNVGYDVLFCREWEKREKYNAKVQESGSTVNAGPPVNLMNASTDIYLGGIPVNSNAETIERYNALSEKQKTARPLVYQAYADFKQEPYTGRLASGVIQPAPYDLQQHPEDICLQVGGWRMAIGEGTPSNIVTIPKEAIAAALTEAK